ncbi:MAG: SusD/RagB family nutrient-binding outer membrane lipoprotein [Paramuribaculum sp.]
MKQYKKLISLALVASTLVGLTGCRDDWSKENTDEKTLAVATPEMLLASAEMKFYPNYYTMWFYNAPVYYVSTQMMGFTGGYTDSRLTGFCGTAGIMMDQLKYFTAMENELSKLSEEEQSQYAPFKEAVRVLAIYGGIFDTDNYGDIPYTEGGRGAYGGALKPNYDRVEALYTLWNSELKNAVSVFKNAQSVSTNATQDIIYGFDWSKWAKFASSLRVKLATRLIHRDLALAKSIVSDAVADGVITETSDDVLFNKVDGRQTDFVTGIDPGEIAFGTGNSTINNWGGSPSENVMNWQLKNRDPRVRFMYTKNYWHSKMIDWYISHGFESKIPPIIKERYETKMVQDEETGQQVKRFSKWKDEFGGNLWARYIGLPGDYEARLDNENEYLNQFYNLDINYKIEFEGQEYTQRTYSRLSQHMIQTNANITVPRVPGENAQQPDDETDVPKWDMYLTAAEINFYLAEFAVYGTPGLESASNYFKKAVTQSVENWDFMANKNNEAYYHKTYGYSPDDVSIALQAGEIDHLLAQPDFQLTGNKADDLEKIFLNMEIHFIYQPMELYVTGRRSGIPKFGSNLVARIDYASENLPASIFPRRSNFGAIAPDDQMRDIIKEVYDRQGFSLNIQDIRDGKLNSERLWQDVGAPQWGAGPNVGI